MASGSKSLITADLPAYTLPAYTVRVSDRTKSVRLSLSVEDGLEVVIPTDYDHQKIPEIIQNKRDWIVRNQLKLMVTAAY